MIKNLIAPEKWLKVAMAFHARTKDMIKRFCWIHGRFYARSIASKCPRCEETGQLLKVEKGW